MAGLFLYLAVLLPLVYIGDVSTFNLTIIHTNDVHSRIEQTNKYSGACSAKDAKNGKCFGGYARLKTKVDEIRGNETNVLLLDGGDQSQGTLWFTEFGSTIMSFFMNQLPYDAMGLGNHEFDSGEEELLNFVKNASFPILSANMDASKMPEMASRVKKYVKLTVAGETIGVVGYTTVETRIISKPGVIKFNPEIASVQAAVDELKGQGVNKIIAVGHAGFEVDQQMAETTTGIDVIVGGHTNTFLYTGSPPSNEVPQGAYPSVFLNTDKEKVLVVQDYAFSKYLGHLEVEFDDNGVVTAWSGNPILLDNSTAQDPDILAIIAPLRQQMNAKALDVVGNTRVYLEGDRKFCRIEECNMGNLAADAMVQDNRRRSDTEGLDNVAIALMNGGGIRSSLDKGDITMENILTVQPFRNTVDVVEMRGQTILEALEYCASRRVVTGDLFGGFLQVSGMRIIYDQRKPVNQRVVEVKMLCGECRIPEYQDLNKTRVYKLIMSTFLSSGGDGYDMFKNDIIKSHMNGDVDSVILRNYIHQYSPVAPSLEGRIRFLSDSTDNTTTNNCTNSKDDDDDDVPCACPNFAGILTSSILVLLSSLTISKLYN